MEPDNPLYKTEPCKNWEKQGQCNYGESCRFAHGDKDLRFVFRTPSYKTKDCHNYKNGECKYGSKCKFRHEDPPSYKLFDDYSAEIEKFFRGSLFCK